MSLSRLMIMWQLWRSFKRNSKQNFMQAAVKECTAEASLKIEWMNVIAQTPTATTSFRAGRIQDNMLVT